MKRRNRSSSEPNSLQRPKLVFVSASDLDNVKLDEDECTPDASTLMELLGAPIGDSCLEAMRTTLTMTYAGADERSGELCLLDIRRIAIKALGELGTELELLGLSRVDADKTFMRDNSPKACLYMIVGVKELRRRVKVEGTKGRVRLDELFQLVPADPVLCGLRRILSMTFREATTPRQHDQVREEIRFVAAGALVPCNPMLEAMEIEPVAMPTWRRFVDGEDTLSGEEDADDAENESAP